MKKTIIIILWSLLGLIAVALLFVSGVVIYSNSYKVKGQKETIVNNTGLVQAYGKSLYDKDGNKIRLEGTNVGGLFVQEGWLSPVSCGTLMKENVVERDKDGNALYPEMPQEEYLKFLKENPELTDEKIQELFDIAYNAWCSDADFELIKDMGMNCFRLPIYWRDILNDDYSRKEESVAFHYIDDFLSKCKEYEIYCIIDMHGAPKSQNGYEHSGVFKIDEKETPELFSDENAINALVDIWDYISSYYSREENEELSAWIASYALLNEPCDQTFHKSTKKTWDILDKCYKAIRENGDLHNISMGGCWNFASLPDPKDYNWENVQYEYHWYNWFTNILPYNLFYAYQDFSNIGRNYDVPVLIGEFTFFEDEKQWNNGLNMFKDRNYSWTTWTYKKAVVGYWNDSWALVNYKLNLSPNEEAKVDVRTASFDEIKNAWANSVLSNCETSSTYATIKDFLEKEHAE